MDLKNFSLYVMTIYFRRLAETVTLRRIKHEPYKKSRYENIPLAFEAKNIHVLNELILFKYSR